MTDGVRLSDLVVGMAFRGTPLASETATFIALQTAEALGGATRVLTSEDVTVHDDGSLTVNVAVESGPDQTAVRALAGMLDAIGGDQLTEATHSLVDRARGGGIASLATMRAELEAVLVPLNRPAARRMLGRFVREQLRMQSGSATASQSGWSGTYGATGATGSTRPDGQPHDPDVDARSLLANESHGLGPSTNARADASTNASGSATDTLIDGNVPARHEDDARSGRHVDTDDLFERALPKKRPASGIERLVQLLAMVAVAAGVVFVLMRLAGR